MAKKQRINLTPSKPRAGSNEDVLKKVLGYVKEWEDYRSKLLKHWDRDNKLYNNERYQRKFEGVADTFVPMTFSTVETIVSAIVNGDLNTDFVPQDIYKYLKDSLMPGYTGEIVGPDGSVMPETEDEYLSRALANAINGGVIEDKSLEVLNALYDYYWDAGDWDIALEHFVRSGVKIGTGGLWLAWENSRPKLINVAFPDYIFDPRAKDDDSCRFAGRRYLTSLSELKDIEIADTKTGTTRKRYKGLNDVQSKPSDSTSQQTDKAMQEKLLFGSTIEATDKDGKPKDTDQVEVIELMTKDRMYTVVNRTVVAEDEENFIVAQAKLRGLDLKKLIPVPGITWANYKNESLLVGKSETSTFWQEQERLNDATNQKSDAVTRALLQNYRANPSLKPQKASFSVPGAVIWATDSGQYEAVPPAQVPSAAFTEEVSIKNNIRETTATDQIVKGVGSSTDVTATEAKLQIAQSGLRPGLKIRSLERGPLKRLARLTLQYVRLFVTDPFIIPQPAAGGIRPILFNPDKYQYDIEPKVTLSVNEQDKQKAERLESLETYQVLIQDPTNNLEEVKKIYLPKISGLDKDEVSRIIRPQDGMPTLPGAPAIQPAEQPLPAAMPQGMSA